MVDATQRWGRRWRRGVRTLAGAASRAPRSARELRRRRRHRRSEGGADRDRRLPTRSGQVQAARGPDPTRGAPDRAARNRKDAARAGACRRGAGTILLDLGLGVRRDVRGRGRGRVAGARPVPAGQGGCAGDHLHRRARRDRALARRRDRRFWRRPRRARADPQPDPHRNGRVRPIGRRDRDLGHQPAGGPRSRVAAPGPVRPSRRRPAPRHGGAAKDTRGAHAFGAAGRRRQHRASGRHDARDGRRRSRQCRQRGGAARRPPSSRCGDDG